MLLIDDYEVFDYSDNYIKTLLVKLCIGYLGSIYLLGMVIDSSICEL
jgi:hypothetical protein